MITLYGAQKWIQARAVVDSFRTLNVHQRLSLDTIGCVTVPHGLWMLERPGEL